jgi:hypothetical protein
VINGVINVIDRLGPAVLLLLFFVLAHIFLELVGFIECLEMLLRNNVAKGVD